MKVIRSIREMSFFSKRNKSRGKSIGFVPTMGALHKGHLSLIKQARKDNDLVVVSIFVNPVQFGRGEDFKKYPRNLKQDARLCRREGADAVFFPGAKAMYPAGYKAYVEVEDLSSVLCGKSRPGHFRGVTTIVAKLFNIVNPDIAYFGQKDAQQAIIIKKMASDLNMATRIIIMPTIREQSGLAMSSRNQYLSPEEKKSAAVLFRALKRAGELIKQGRRDSAGVIKEMRSLIRREPAVKIDYIAIVEPEGLKPVSRIKNKVLIALAAWLGKTRLIDNIIINA